MLYNISGFTITLISLCIGTQGSPTIYSCVCVCVGVCVWMLDGGWYIVVCVVCVCGGGGLGWDIIMGWGDRFSEFRSFEARYSIYCLLLATFLLRKCLNAFIYQIISHFPYHMVIMPWLKNSSYVGYEDKYFSFVHKNKNSVVGGHIRNFSDRPSNEYPQHIFIT